MISNFKQNNIKAISRLGLENYGLYSYLYTKRKGKKLTLTQVADELGKGDRFIQVRLQTLYYFGYVSDFKGTFTFNPKGT
jgi:hypothetical protein